MIKVNEETCMGCAVCVRVCPTGFEMVGNIAKVKDREANCIEKAIEVCPVDAISVDNNDTSTVRQATKKDVFTKHISEKSFGSGRGLGRGNRSNGPGTGSGPGGYCICPQCGHKEPHLAGTPCFRQTCPQCNSVMTR